MKRSLKVLCGDHGFSEMQKTYFKEGVDALLAESGRGKNGALFCLRRLFHCYDVGGHSMGRSLRSLILEKVMSWLRGDESVGGKPQTRKAKTALSVLVAMHYDYEYINRQGWFDYKLVAMCDIPLMDRILVSAAAMALGIDGIPSLDEWPKDRVLAFIMDF